MDSFGIVCRLHPKNTLTIYVRMGYTGMMYVSKYGDAAHAWGLGFVFDAVSSW